MSPGTNSTPPKLTVTSRSPAPVFSLFRGFVPSALMPNSMSPSAAASRTAPFTISPVHPLDWAKLRDQIADQGRMQRTAAVDHQHAAVAGRRQHRLQQRIVLGAPHGGDRAGELRSCAELAELNVAAANVGTDVVDQVGGRPKYHSHRAMLIVVVTQLSHQQDREQADRYRHRQRYR